MTAPSPAPVVTTGEPVAVILARMEVKLDQALADGKKNAATLDRQDGRLQDHDKRLTVLETRVLVDNQHAQFSLSSRALLWSAISACAVVAGILITLWAAH